MVCCGRVLRVQPVVRANLDHLRHNLVSKQVLPVLYELAMGRFVFHTSNCRSCSRCILLRGGQQCGAVDGAFAAALDHAVDAFTLTAHALQTIYVD